MKDLLSIVVWRIAAEWKIVAYGMDFEIAEVNIIEKKCRDDPEECCVELLKRWLQAKPDKNWEMLLSVLKQVKKLIASSKEIEKDVRKLQLYVNYIFELTVNVVCIQGHQSFRWVFSICY